MSRLLWFATLAFTTACSSPPVARPTQSPTHASNNASKEPADVFFWPRSPEYAALTTQIYDRAAAVLKTAIAAPHWSAEIPVTPDDAAQPPAVILDVDETVLDNSAYVRELTRTGTSHNEGSWGAFCRRVESVAVPGAAEFIKAAQGNDVSVMLISNRDHSLRAATLQNLEKVGIRLAEQDQLMLLGEREGWISDKTARRDAVQSAYRVILMFGDSLNDFIAFYGTEPLPQLETYRSQFRDRWYVLPNPYYGAWVRRVR